MGSVSPDLAGRFESCTASAATEVDERIETIGAEQQRRIGKAAQGKGALRCHDPRAVRAISIQPFERREREYRVRAQDSRRCRHSDMRRRRSSLWTTDPNPNMARKIVDSRVERRRAEEHPADHHKHEGDRDTRKAGGVPAQIRCRQALQHEQHAVVKTPDDEGPARRRATARTERRRSTDWYRCAACRADCRRAGYRHSRGTRATRTCASAARTR